MVYRIRITRTGGARQVLLSSMATPRVSLDLATVTYLLRGRRSFFIGGMRARILGSLTRHCGSGSELCNLSPSGETDVRVRRSLAERSTLRRFTPAHSGAEAEKIDFQVSIYNLILL